MLEIEMTQDIQDIEPKILGPLTLRQIICLAIALAYGLPIFFLLPGDTIIRAIITVIIMSPALICGWVKVYEQPLEKFVANMIKNTFIKPQERKYVIENEYAKYIDTLNKKQVKVKRSKQYKGTR